MIDLSLDDEAREIVTAAAELLAKAAPIERLRHPDGELALSGVLAEWGWFAMGAAADEGGLGLGMGAQVSAWVEAGRRLASPSLVATALAACCGPVGLRPAMQAGSARAAFAIADGAGSVFALDRSDAAILVRLDGKLLHFHQAADFTGTLVEPFDETVPTELGRLDAPPLFSNTEGDRAALLIAALLAGNADGAATLAIDYACVREQFGQPIGSFQAVKHRCVDMGVAAFAAQAQVLLAAATLAEDAPGAQLELAAAVMQSRRAARANGQGAIQVHGGMGFTAECHAHRFFKRAHVLMRLLGDEERYAMRLLTTN